MTLFYLPLEPYKERYTEQWSAPKTGWLERNWIKEGIDYHRINGDLNVGQQRPIQGGVVLDAARRCKYAMSQVSELINLIEAGTITNNDVIYWDDFWHPGIESLPYCFDIYNVHPKTFCFLHAQSVDCFDFTYKMRGWMRFYEQCLGRFLTGIFTSCPTLKKLIVDGGIAPKEKVYDTGHPFCSEEVLERMPPLHSERNNTVIWASRWDKEKNPGFFLALAEHLINQRADINFKVCTGSQHLRSNIPSLVDRAYELRSLHPYRFKILENLTKEQYYHELSLAKIQFNCASQDFVAITLLESSTAGCYPIYPRFRSFPETFRNQKEFMYEHLSLYGAADKICSIINRNDLWSDRERAKRAWIHTRFDTAWKSQWDIMNGKDFRSPFDV